MNERTREALERSIKHWEDMLTERNPVRIFLGIEDCALCNIYIDDIECGKCPAALKTGYERCRETPYYKAWEAWNAWTHEYNRDEDTEYKYTFRAACREEIQFLKSLREDEIE